MAAIDFPNNPEINDEYTAGTRTWIWDGTVWKSKTNNTQLLVEDAIAESKAYTDLLEEDVSAHTSATTNVHGIADTSSLVDVLDLQGAFSAYDLDINLRLDDKAELVHSHQISDVINLELALDSKALADHTHTISDVDELELELLGKSNVGHTHQISEVTGLASALDGKAGTIHGHAIADVTGLQPALDAKAASLHSHEISDVNGLTSALSDKADIDHGHQIADVENLQEALDSKSATGHTHVVSDISGVTVSASEINLLANASSNIQEQINGKANSSHSHTISDVTGLQTELDEKSDIGHQHVLADISDVTATPTEVNYVSGVTSSIQSQINAKASLSGATFTGFVTLHADPTQALHAATKEYVDNVAAGIISKPSVYAATTANLDATYNNGASGVGSTLTSNSNGQFPVVDGVQLSTQNGFRGILVKNQTNAAHNGRYNLTTLGDENTPWVLTKCALCDTANEVPGSYIFITDGDVNGGTGWVLFVNDPATFVVGTDPVFAFQFSGSGAVTAGTNISVSGSQVSVIDSPVFEDITVTDSATFDGATISGLSLGEDIDDVSISTTASGDVLLWDGTSWINRYVNAIPAKSIQPTITSNNYNIVASDAGMIIEINGSSATTVTIPSSETFAVGTQMIVLQVGTGATSVVVESPATQTLNYSPGNQLRGQWTAATILKRATNNWILYGDIVEP